MGSVLGSPKRVGKKNFMKIDPKTIKELAKLLEQTGLTEIEVAEGDKVIRVSKGATAVVSSSGVSAHNMPSRTRPCRRPRI